MTWEDGGATKPRSTSPRIRGVPVLKAADRVLTDMRPVTATLPNGPIS